MRNLLGKIISVTVLVGLALAKPQGGSISGKVPFQNPLPSWLYSPFFSMMRNPKTCSFNGPQDSPTLRGLNFLENYGAGSCLTLQKPTGEPNGVTRIEMAKCTWNDLPVSSQLYFIQNGNGGSIVRAAVSGGFGINTCLAPSQLGFGSSPPFGSSSGPGFSGGNGFVPPQPRYPFLQGEMCSLTGKDRRQTWRFNKIHSNLYQVVNLETNQCLRVDSTRVGVVPAFVKCNFSDIFQLWRICTSK
jgi:hypothetical protein